MTRIIISDTIGSVHANDIISAISQGYGSDISDQIEVIQNWQTLLDRVESDSNIIAVIKSSTGVEYYPSIARSWYPRVQMFMPLGSNNFVELTNLNAISVIISCGAGDTNFEARNNTGYGLGLEFWDNDLYQSADGDASSFANGYILGKLLKIKDELSCSWWEARYRARMTATRTEGNRQTSPWDLYNGYGIIDVAAALTFSGAIASDPYILSVEFNPTPVDFGDVPVGHPSTRSATITVNKNYTLVDGNGVSFSPKTFSAGTHQVSITITPESVGAYSYEYSSALTLLANAVIPDVDVSDMELDFGLVYMGESKQMVLDAKTVTPVVIEDNKPFYVSPKTFSSDTAIVVTFTPCICGTFERTIMVGDNPVVCKGVCGLDVRLTNELKVSSQERFLVRMEQKIQCMEDTLLSLMQFGLMNEYFSTSINELKNRNAELESRILTLEQ